ncbi:aspartate/glutamate racemase family protein [Neorhodopirellula pilleata]|uniref:Glutamate racemase n=1 Tax=Neorhodopirellula pilleata TaxID=2714738 RepID=A0A5C6ATS2_9BACT|nr:aspartate/glutamate racemase family protein [Neorhodopirellula pilleata]TWU03395.1 Glutamate racemase [Neorhodopirellula pilleata]
MSVLKSLWAAGVARNAVFMADYAVNPLGVKSDTAIATVVEQWVEAAQKEADVLIFACNTLSIRYQQLTDSRNVPGLSQIISMVNCFTAMVECERERLVNQRVLIIGTTFTASQPIYCDILTDNVPGVVVSSVAATALERVIARFEPWETESNEVITSDLRRALESTDVAVLACTCFPMAMAQLKLLFPRVRFLDPGEYCARLLEDRAEEEKNELRVRVTGHVVETQRVTDFASWWLGAGRVTS